MRDDNDSSNATDIDVLLNAVPRCIDLSIFNWYEQYSQFGYYVNGVGYVALAVFGCIGNLLMMWSVRDVHCNRQSRNHRRLCLHLRALCLWDTLLLCCWVAMQGIPTLYEGVIGFSGSQFHVTRTQILTPLIGIAGVASRWQIVAISAERFLALHDPFGQLGRGVASVTLLCLVIAIGAVLVHVLDMLEATQIRCLDQRTHTFMYQMAPNVVSDSYFYRVFCRLIPDFVFINPVPFLLIAVLTLRTLHIRRQSHDRQMLMLSSMSTRHRAAQHGLSTPVILFLLNIKFLICTSGYTLFELFRFTSIYFDLALFGPNLTSFVIGDVCNFLLVVQSATNWMLFVQWRDTVVAQRSSTRSRTLRLPDALALTSSQRSAKVSRHVANSPPQLYTTPQLVRMRQLWQACWQAHGAQLGVLLLANAVQKNEKLIEQLARVRQTTMTTTAEPNNNDSKADDASVASGSSSNRPVLPLCSVTLNNHTVLYNGHISQHLHNICRSKTTEQIARSSAQLVVLGNRIGLFLNQVIGELLADDCGYDALNLFSDRLRAVGAAYGRERVRIGVRDWHNAKELLIHKILGDRTVSAHDEIVVSKLVCLIIRELRHGWLRGMLVAAVDTGCNDAPRILTPSNSFFAIPPSTGSPPARRATSPARANTLA